MGANRLLVGRHAHEQQLLLVLLAIEAQLCGPIASLIAPLIGTASWQQPTTSIRVTRAAFPRCCSSAHCIKQFRLAWPGGSSIKINYGGGLAWDLSSISTKACLARPLWRSLARPSHRRCFCTAAETPRWSSCCILASALATRACCLPPIPRCGAKSQHACKPLRASLASLPCRRRLHPQPAQQRNRDDHAQHHPPGCMRGSGWRHAVQLLISTDQFVQVHSRVNLPNDPPKQVVFLGKALRCASGRAFEEP